MKGLLSTSLAVLAAVRTASAAEPYRGFNVGANRNSDNACKTVQDWKDDMNTIKGWGHGFNAVKLYSTSQCQQLDRAAEAARATDMFILVGMWSGGGPGAVQAEMDALRAAITKHGRKWVAAITVGSEDLYRKEVTPQEIASQIDRARAIVGKGVKITHSDTWTAWVEGANKPVVDKVDFVNHNSFPYWEGATPQDLPGAFFRALDRTKGASAGKPVWVGETGEPTAGDNFGAAVPSRQNLQLYWTNVACALIRTNVNFFWYSAFDAPFAKAGVEQNFGVADRNRRLKINLKC